MGHSANTPMSFRWKMPMGKILSVFAVFAVKEKILMFI